MKLNKKLKGMTLGDMPTAATAVMILVIVVAVCAMILGTMNDNVSNANATQVLDAGLNATVQFSNWFVIIVVVIVSVVLLGLVYYLQNRSGGAA